MRNLLIALIASSIFIAADAAACLCSRGPCTETALVNAVATERQPIPMTMEMSMVPIHVRIA